MISTSVTKFKKKKSYAPPEQCLTYPWGTRIPLWELLTYSMLIEPVEPYRIRTTLKSYCFNVPPILLLSVQCQIKNPVSVRLFSLHYSMALSFSGKTPARISQSHHKCFLHSVKTEQLKGLIMVILPLPSSPVPLFPCSAGGMKARICLFCPPGVI